MKTLAELAFLVWASGAAILGAFVFFLWIVFRIWTKRYPAWFCVDLYDNSGQNLHDNQNVDLQATDETNKKS